MSCVATTSKNSRLHSFISTAERSTQSSHRGKKTSNTLFCQMNVAIATHTHTKRYFRKRPVRIKWATLFVSNKCYNTSDRGNFICSVRVRAFYRKDQWDHSNTFPHFKITCTVVRYSLSLYDWLEHARANLKHRHWRHCLYYNSLREITISKNYQYLAKGITEVVNAKQHYYRHFSLYLCVFFSSCDYTPNKRNADPTGSSLKETTI